MSRSPQSLTSSSTTPSPRTPKLLGKAPRSAALGLQIVVDHVLQRTLSPSSLLLSCPLPVPVQERVGAPADIPLPNSLVCRLRRDVVPSLIDVDRFQTAHEFHLQRRMDHLYQCETQRLVTQRLLAPALAVFCLNRAKARLAKAITDMGDMGVMDPKHAAGIHRHLCTILGPAGPVRHHMAQALAQNACPSCALYTEEHDQLSPFLMDSSDALGGDAACIGHGVLCRVCHILECTLDADLLETRNIVFNSEGRGSVDTRLSHQARALVNRAARDDAHQHAAACRVTDDRLAAMIGRTAPLVESPPPTPGHDLHLSPRAPATPEHWAPTNVLSPRDVPMELLPDPDW